MYCNTSNQRMFSYIYSLKGAPPEPGVVGKVCWTYLNLFESAPSFNCGCNSQQHASSVLACFHFEVKGYFYWFLSLTYRDLAKTSLIKKMAAI